jgi:hypothetical protein
MKQSSLLLATCLSFVVILGWPVKSQGQAPASAVTPAVVDPKKALDGLPQDVLRDLKKDASKGSPALKLADEKAKSNLEGKLGTIEIKVKETGDQAGMLTLMAPEDEIRIGGTAFMLELYILLDPSQRATGEMIKAGSRVKATGTIYAYVMYGGTKPVLKLEFAKAVLIK